MKIKSWLGSLLAICIMSTSVMAYETGDINRDGVVNIYDATAVAKYVIGAESLDEEQLTLADVNGDGGVDLYDAGNIAKYVIGEETTAEVTTEVTTEYITETTTEAVYNKSWNFSDSEFSNLGTISTNTYVGGINFIPGSSKTISVNKDSQTLGDTVYSYALSYSGGGNIGSLAVSFDVLGPCTINVVTRSGGSDTRTLNIANAQGVIGTVPAEGTIAKHSFSYTGNADVLYMYSKGSRIQVYYIEVIYDGGVWENDTTTESSTETTTKTDITETTTETTTVNVNDGVVVYDYTGLVNAISTAAKNGGGNVYVSGNNIDCTERIRLTSANANVNIVGLTNADGTSPRLNFASFRDSKTSTGESGTGIHITGSYYNLKNLIIENAPDCGIRIKGSSAGNCTLENLVLRYNNNSGLSITAGGANNTVKYVDSYRNCDLVQNAGGDADGFSVKLAAGGGNTFYNCRAWENGDDGWDSYDRGDLIPELSYEECACWHNGETDIFTGEYDWKQGNPLDKNLIYVKAILESDPTFEAKYNNGEITSWPQLTLNYFGVSRTYSSMYSDWGGNPNGFKFGSVNSTSDCYRYIKNCLAFDHAAKGFDQNNGACTFDLENTVSFDNQRNYVMEKMKVNSAKNAVGFSGTSSDSLPSGMSVTKPSTSVQSSIRTEVDNKVKYILECVSNDRVPGEVLFNIF